MRFNLDMASARSHLIPKNDSVMIRCIDLLRPPRRWAFCEYSARASNDFHSLSKTGKNYPMNAEISQTFLHHQKREDDGKPPLSQGVAYLKRRSKGGKWFLAQMAGDDNGILGTTSRVDI